MEDYRLWVKYLNYGLKIENQFEVFIATNLYIELFRRNCSKSGTLCFFL